MIWFLQIEKSNKKGIVVTQCRFQAIHDKLDFHKLLLSTLLKWCPCSARKVGEKVAYKCQKIISKIWCCYFLTLHTWEAGQNIVIGTTGSQPCTLPFISSWGCLTPMHTQITHSSLPNSSWQIHRLIVANNQGHSQVDTPCAPHAKLHYNMSRLCFGRNW